MHDSLEKLSIDCTFASLRPLNVIFPWLVEYDIGEFNKINTKNSDDVVRVIKNFLETANDWDSVYFKVLEAEKGLDKTQVFKDVMSFMFGGHETNSWTLTSILLYLKWYPEWEQIIWSEINEVIFENGKYSEKDLWTWLTGDILENCFKTSCFIKEILRVAPPASRSLGYIAMRDFTMKDGL